MYTSGIDQVSLDEAGARYFSSSKPENWKNGLKLHVEVVPQAQAGGQPKQVKKVMNAQELATGPEPSATTSCITASTLMLIGPALLCFTAL